MSKIKELDIEQSNELKEFIESNDVYTVLNFILSNYFSDFMDFVAMETNLIDKDEAYDNIEYEPSYYR